MYTIKMVPRNEVKVTETRGRKPGSKNKTKPEKKIEYLRLNLDAFSTKH